MTFLSALARLMNSSVILALHFGEHYNVYNASHSSAYLTYMRCIPYRGLLSSLQDPCEMF